MKLYFYHNELKIVQQIIELRSPKHFHTNEMSRKSHMNNSKTGNLFECFAYESLKYMIKKLHIKNKCAFS